MTRQRSPNEAFVRTVDNLTVELVDLDKAFQKTGSSGFRPGVCANNFRTTLRVLKDWFLKEIPLGGADCPQELRLLPLSSAELFRELRKFAGMSSDNINNLFSRFLTLQAEIEIKMGVLKTQIRFDVDQVNDLENDLAMIFGSMQPILENMVYETTRSIEIQSVENQKYVNLTVIATFLSGVTTSVLQLVGPANSNSGNPFLSTVVMTSLFSSLIISSASAALSLLAISWIQTIVYHSSMSEINPRSGNVATKLLDHSWMTWVLREGALATLLFAGALFVLGLVFYMFTSQQDLVVSIITTCFAGLLSVVILILALSLSWNHWRVTRDLKERFNFHEDV